MQLFYNEYNQELTNMQRPVAYLTNGNITLPIKQLGWAHNIVLMQRVKDLKARYWYMIQSIKNSWSRDFLVESIKGDS